jgi:hypothetical protein
MRKGSTMKTPYYAARGAFVLAATMMVVTAKTNGQAIEEANTPADPNTVTQDVVDGPTPSPPPKLPEPDGARRLSPQYDVWVDPKKGVVLVDGQVSLRRGMLEMFACLRNTKEHESVVTADTQAFLVHTGLIMIGAEPGTPVQFVPEYKPPTGTEIEVTATWWDEQGKEHTVRSQEWVRDVRTGKELAHPWVFAGSRFYTDEETGKQYYQAEGGDFICVSNFSTALADIPVPSSQSNDALEYEAFTDRIPPLGTRVRLTLKPVVDKNAEGGGGKVEESSP